MPARSAPLAAVTPLRRTSGPVRTPMARRGPPRTTQEADRMEPTQCDASDCDRPRRRGKWCGKHYGRVRRHGDPNRVDRPGLREDVRFAKMVMLGVPSSHRPDLGPCLLFTGSENGHGYGQFRFNGRGGYAHRFAWERARGPIPAGLQIDHLCRVRICVEVTHMEVVDGPTNTRRATAAMKMCRSGKHERTPENTYCSPAGRNSCRLCRVGRERNAASTYIPARGLATGPKAPYDQQLVRAVIAKVRAGEQRVADAARVIGCSPTYMGRRIWCETKADVLLRDNGRCLCCGAEADDVHHRRGRGSGGCRDPLISFGMANLMSLCRTCHDYIGADPTAAYAKGWAIRGRQQRPANCPVFLPGFGWARLADDGTVTAVPSGDTA